MLKACRVHSGMTQEEIALKMYVNQSDISKFENNMKEPTISIVHSWIVVTQTLHILINLLCGMNGIEKTQYFNQLQGA